MFRVFIVIKVFSILNIPVFSFDQILYNYMSVHVNSVFAPFLLHSLFRCIMNLVTQFKGKNYMYCTSCIFFSTICVVCTVYVYMMENVCVVVEINVIHSFKKG